MTTSSSSLSQSLDINSNNSNDSNNEGVYSFTFVVNITNVFLSFLRERFRLMFPTTQTNEREHSQAFLIVLTAIMISAFPTAIAIKKFVIPAILRIFLKVFKQKGVLISIGEIGFLRLRDVEIVFDLGDVEFIKIEEIRYVGRLRHLVNWFLKTLSQLQTQQSQSNNSNDNNENDSSTRSSERSSSSVEDDNDNENVDDNDKKSGLIAQNSNRLMKVPIRFLDVQVKRRKKNKTKEEGEKEEEEKQKEDGEGLDGDYVEKSDNHNNDSDDVGAEEIRKQNNDDDEETSTVSKRLRENFKNRVFARFLSLLEIVMVDLKIYDDETFAVTTTQMILTTKPIRDALTVFLKMPNGIRIVPKSVQVGRKENLAIAVSSVSCSARADLMKIGKVSDMKCDFFGIDPIFMDDAQDFFNHARIERVRIYHIPEEEQSATSMKQNKNKNSISRRKSSFSLGYEIRNARAEGFCVQNTVTDSRVGSQIDSKKLAERVKSSIMFTVPEINGQWTKNINTKNTTSKDDDGENENGDTISFKMERASVDFQDDCSFSMFSRKFELGVLEFNQNKQQKDDEITTTSKVILDYVQIDWDPDAHFLIETLSSDFKKLFSNLSCTKKKKSANLVVVNNNKKEKKLKHNLIVLDAKNVSIAADLTLGANIRVASKRLHSEDISKGVGFENFEIQTNAETFFSTESLALEKRKRVEGYGITIVNGWDVTSAGATLKFSRDLDYGDFHAALLAGESAFRQALKKFVSGGENIETKIISKASLTNEKFFATNLPTPLKEVRWISEGGNAIIIEDSQKLESFLRMQEAFLKPELERSRRILRKSDEVKDAEMFLQIFQNVAKAYKKSVDDFNKSKKDIRFVNRVDNILTIQAQTLDWSFKYGCDVEKRGEIGNFCRFIDAPYSNTVDLQIVQSQTINLVCEKFNIFLGGEEFAMFEAKMVTLQGPLVLAKQSVHSEDSHLLPFLVGKRRFAAIRSVQSHSRPSVMAFTNLISTWTDAKLRYLASSEPKYAILSREISNRVVPKSRHSDAPKSKSNGDGVDNSKKIKDSFPWWDNLRHLWRGDFTIVGKNSQIVVDSSLKDAKVRHALAFKASKCECTYKSGHILLRAARFAVSKEMSFTNSSPSTLFVAPAAEISVKYEWLTKDNINGYATSYRFDEKTGNELRTLSECKSCEGSHELSIQFACKDTLLPGWRADLIRGDTDSFGGSGIEEESDGEEYLTPQMSAKKTSDGFQTPLSSFQTSSNTMNNDPSSPPILKWQSEDFANRLSTMRLSSPARMSSKNRGYKTNLHSILNSFDGIALNSHFTETPYFRFNADDMKYMRKWWKAVRKPDLVSLRGAWKQKQFHTNKNENEAERSKTKKTKQKSMMSILYSKRPSWQITAEYMNYSLPVKEKEETVQGIAAFLEGFNYSSNEKESLSVHAEDLRVFLPEKEEKDVIPELNKMASANFDDAMREMLRGANNQTPSPTKFQNIGDSSSDRDSSRKRITHATLRELVTDSMLVLESREFRVRKATAEDEVRVDVNAPRALLEAKTREKVFSCIRDMWKASFGDEASMEIPPPMFELEKLAKNLVDAKYTQDHAKDNRHKKSFSATSGFSESLQQSNNAEATGEYLDLLHFLKPEENEGITAAPVIDNDGGGTMTDRKASKVTDEKCLFVVQISEPQINLRGSDRNGRLLLAAESSLVVGRRVTSSSDNRQRLVDVNLSYVEAHIAPTDIDVRAGVQWLEDKYSSEGMDSKTPHLRPKQSSLLRQIFAPCEMLFKHSTQIGEGGENNNNGGNDDDDSDAPTKISFKSPDIDATMESEQQAVLVDVIGSLFLTPATFTLPSAKRNAIALLKKKGQRSLFDQEDAAASAIVATPLLEYIKCARALKMYDIDFPTSVNEKDDHPKRREILHEIKRKEKLLSKSVRRAESLTKYNRKRAAMEMNLEIERGAWALRKGGKTFMNAEITNLSLVRERHIDSSGVTLFKLKGLHLQTIEKVILGRWLVDEELENVPSALRMKPNFLQISAYRAASPPEAPIWNHLEVLLSPFQIDINKEIYQTIYDYAFPSERAIKSEKMRVEFEKEFQITTTTIKPQTISTKDDDDASKKLDFKKVLTDGKEENTEIISKDNSDDNDGEDDDVADDDDDVNAMTTGPKVVQVKYLRFNESKVKVSYHGSAGSFKDVRLLLDAYTCESFEGKWRELVGHLKGNLAWSALKSVTGFAGRKLNKMKSSNVVTAEAASVVKQSTIITKKVAENDEEEEKEEIKKTDDNKINKSNSSTNENSSSLASTPTKKRGSIFKKIFKTTPKKGKKDSGEKSERDLFMSGFTK